MTPQAFIAKWQRSKLSEKSACQQHFLDLCTMLGEPTPAEVDPDGDEYTFEKGVKTADGHGWADVWKKGHFAWEYKGKHKDLAKAYEQLQKYRINLENPPLLVVCDMARFEIRTNFTNKPEVTYQFGIEKLEDPYYLKLLKNLFANPSALEPEKPRAVITEKAAECFQKLAASLRLHCQDSAAASPTS